MSGSLREPSQRQVANIDWLRSDGFEKLEHDSLPSLLSETLSNWLERD